ncbi:hypothetical protein, variant 1 [Aphanomyces astaci]|uniref:Sugar phosphate transporter domain-containing protein n=1 Tax=Aphanomyces astaci TaxID=112090 RepID=W4GIM7_APHAT|nr:hypothetical protein, variant 1 [Aphanomyces astaci]ETV78894.1 hypothetical protein, variant 1 [Aphanomyces astaci]|eukprot:XP_009831613.1 hypothetical protein, variant 1 [Aphanomyces astaci]
MKFDVVIDMSVQQTAVDRKIHASPTSTGRSFVGNTSHYAVCLWLSLWFALNMTVTIVNKQALTVLNLPVTLTCVHMACNSIGAYLYVHLSCRGGARGRPLPLRPDQAITMFFFSFIFVSNIILGNWSLGLVSVSLNQIMRALVPGTTAVLSTVVLHTTYTMAQILALVPIALGVYIACSRDIASTPMGIAITALAILFASLKSVLSSKFLTGHVTVTPVQLILHQAPLSAVWCAVVMILGDIILPGVYIFCRRVGRAAVDAVGCRASCRGAVRCHRGIQLCSERDQLRRQQVHVRCDTGRVCQCQASRGGGAVRGYSWR